MKKFSSSAKSFWNYRSLSLPKGRNAVTGSTLTCHPEWYTEPADYVYAGAIVGSSLVDFNSYGKENAFSVRCVKD